MSLWVDKHRPTSLSKLDYHKEQAKWLKGLVCLTVWNSMSGPVLYTMFALQVQGSEFPHLLVYGPSGAGKKTRIMCLLRELYGSGTEKLRIEHMNFTVS